MKINFLKAVFGGFLLLFMVPSARADDPWPAGAGTDISAGLPAGYEPSGAVWHDDLELLFVVSDDGWVSWLDQSGSGVQTWVTGGDLEGITIADSSSNFVYLGVEEPDAIREFNWSAQTLTGQSWDLTPWMTGSSNAGLEALTFVPNGDHPYASSSSGGLFYAGLQADGKIYVFDVDLSVSGNVSYVAVLEPNPGTVDISGLHYQPETQVLYAVYDSANQLLELESDGTLIRTYQLAGSNQEGVALIPNCPASDTEIFIAEDSGALRRYDGFPIQCATATPSPTSTPTAAPTLSPTMSPTVSPPPSPPPTVIPTVSIPIPTPSPIVSAGAATGDYDGDGTSDVALYRPSVGLWLVRGLSRIYFGGTADEPIPADYNGDGTWDYAYYRSSVSFWKVRNQTQAYFGNPGDIPVVADYDGDNSAEIAFFRPAEKLWNVLDTTRFYFGASSDTPMAYDFNGDGTDEGAIYRETSGLWKVRNLTQIYFGDPGDVPVVADYNGDGSDDIAWFRPTTKLWRVYNLTQTYFGKSDDVIFPADFNGDGTSDYSYFRPSVLLWRSKGVTRVYFGQSSDSQITNPY